MKSLEATGKNVKEAIKAGCTQLGCDADDVEIQVLEMGSPGLFGMFGKPAKVRLTLKKGSRFVRGMMLCVLFLLLAKMITDMLQ